MKTTKTTTLLTHTVGFSRGIIALLLLGALSGCSAQYTQSISNQALISANLRHEYQLDRTTRWVLPADARLYLSQASPFDAVSNDLSPAGEKMQLIFQEAFKRGFADVMVADDTGSETVVQALISARKARADVLVYVSFIFTKDRLNSVKERFRGLTRKKKGPIGADELEVQIVLFDVNSSRAIDVATAKSSSHVFASKKKALGTMMESLAQEYVYRLGGLGVM